MANEKIVPIAYTTIDFDQAAGGVFTSCTFPSLTLTNESIDVFTQQGVNEKIHTNSVLTFGDVTLTRGVTDNKSLHDWAVTLAQSGMQGNTKNVTLSACDNKGQPLMTWSLSDAYIKSYNPGQTQAGKSAVLMETIVLGFKEAKRTQ